MKYELIREIFNKCSGNQMRDVFVSEIETEDPEGYLRGMLVGDDITIEQTHTRDGLIFDVMIDGMHQRFSFTED